MITYSGILVVPDNRNAPTISDIAISLGRHPRFGGATKRYWSVLLHSFVCERLIALLNPSPVLRTYALFHDGHEAITCDVPSTWKTELVREQQRRLDGRIYRQLGISAPTTYEAYKVKEVDNAAFLAEAHLYGPPGILDWAKRKRPGQRAASSLSLKVAAEVGIQYPDAWHCDGPTSPAVVDFIRLARELILSWP